MTVDELQVLITANTNELRKEINKANQTIAGLKKSADKSTSSVTTAFKKLKTGIVALGIGKVIKDSITSGMDAIETDSLFKTVMDDNYEAVRNWSNGVADVLGLNAVNMQKNIGVIYNMVDSMGVAEDNALKMAKGVSVLAEDMASFYNLDSTEAFNKLRAGLTGETEPLKALGILVDENTIKQVAYSQGIAEVGAELTQEQKVLARYKAILLQTGNAQGDLARTLDSPSNMLRSLKQNVTNLGIAFSNFLMPAVKAVLPWLIALAKVATQALNSLASIFNLTGDDVSEETKKVSDDAGGLAGSYDDATKSAKKLKNTLAGFDEMNVLQDKESDATSTGGSGGESISLDFDVGDYDANLGEVKDKIGGLVESIKKEFASIGEGINFNNLITAFNKLKTAIEPITGKIWDGLKWAYSNILKPLAQWTIGEAVPAFMNTLSGALELLNPFLESFQKLGGWLWDNFLSPIAEWTGGVIVDVLNGTGEALSAIGEWASANQGVIDAMVATFATFFGLWKLTELLAFIQMSGGLAGAFKTITTAITACTTAKLKDLAETMYLKALYAGDFIKSIVSGTTALLTQAQAWLSLTLAKAKDTITTGLNTTAQLLLNKAKLAGTAITNALSTAFTFLTSPIGLVVLAITAVVAIVVLCIKYWDEIKEVATKVWEAIKNAWGSASTWFNDKVVQPVKNFFSGLWDGLKNGASKAWEGIKSVFSTVANFFKNIFSKAWEGVVKVFSPIGEVFSNIKEGVISVFKTVVNGLIKGINTVVSLPFKGLNNILEKLHDVSILGVKPFGWLTWRAPVPQIPLLARGGVVESPTLAMVGEAGKEAVMPLERNTGWIDQLATKIGEKLGGGVGDIRLTVKLGEEAIFDRFIEYSREKSFETNGEVVFA